MRVAKSRKTNLIVKYLLMNPHVLVIKHGDRANCHVRAGKFPLPFPCVIVNSCLFDWTVFLFEAVLFVGYGTTSVPVQNVVTVYVNINRTWIQVTGSSLLWPPRVKPSYSRTCNRTRSTSCRSQRFVAGTDFAVGKSSLEHWVSCVEKAIYH